MLTRGNNARAHAFWKVVEASAEEKIRPKIMAEAACNLQGLFWD
jgi:hypothetical protein